MNDDLLGMGDPPPASLDDIRAHLARMNYNLDVAKTILGWMLVVVLLLLVAVGLVVLGVINFEVTAA